MVRIINCDTQELIEELRGAKRGVGKLINYSLSRRHFDKPVLIEIPEGANLELFMCCFDADLIFTATKTPVHYGVSQVQLSNVAVSGLFSINTSQIKIVGIHHCAFLYSAIIAQPWNKDEFPTPTKPFDTQ